MKRFVLGAAALALSASAFAADTYIGGALGPSSIDIDCNFSCEDGDMGVKIYGGIGMPISGKARDSVSGGGAGAYHDIEVSALTFGAALRAKFTPALTGVGRLGVAYVDGKSTVGASVFSFGASRSESSSEMNLHFGLGLEYALNKQFKLTGAADFTSYDTGNDSGDARLFSVGLQYGF